jgi:hypothetical protein
VIDPIDSVSDPVHLDMSSQATWPQRGILVLAQNNRGVVSANKNEAITIGFPSP